MTTKFFRFLRGLYEPALVLLVVGAAGLLLYALYTRWAVGAVTASVLKQPSTTLAASRTLQRVLQGDARGQCGCHEI